jgi:hypothetical protein
MQAHPSQVVLEHTCGSTVEIGMTIAPIMNSEYKLDLIVGNQSVLVFTDGDWPKTFLQASLVRQGAATLVFGKTAIPLSIEASSEPLRIVLKPSAIASISNLSLVDHEIEVIGEGSLEIGVLRVTQKSKITGSGSNLTIAITDLIGPFGFSLDLKGTAGFSLGTTGKTIGHFHIDRFIWTDQFAFNAFVSANDSTTIDVQNSVESTTEANRRITLVPLDLDAGGAKKLPDKLIFFEGATDVDLHLEFDKSSDIRGFSQTASQFDVFHDGPQWGLTRVRSWEQVAGRFCFAAEASECPSDYDWISDLSADRDSVAQSIHNSPTVTHLTFLILDHIPSDYVFDFNVSATFLGSRSPDRIHVTLGHTAIACDLKLEHVVVSIANPSVWSGRVGSLTVSDVEFNGDFPTVKFADLSADYASYKSLVAASPNLAVSVLQARDFPAGTIALADESFAYGNFTIPRQTRLTLTFSRSSNLVIARVSGAAVLHHELRVASTCDMAYSVRGGWPAGFTGITFANLRGTLSVDADAPFAIGDIEDGAVIEVSSNVVFNGLLDLHANVEFRSASKVTVSVAEAILHSGYRIGLKNVTLTVGRATHNGGGAAPLAPIALAGSLALREAATLDVRGVTFLSSSVVSIPFAFHDRPLLWVDPDDAPSLVNISTTGSGDISPLVIGRPLDIICGNDGIGKWRATIASPWRVSTKWRERGDEKCLVLIFDRPEPTHRPVPTDFLFDDDEEEIKLYVSAWTLAGVAAAALGLMLCVCWRKRRANRPEAFEQTYGRGPAGPDEIIQIDDIDEDVL